MVLFRKGGGYHTRQLRHQAYIQNRAVAWGGVVKAPRQLRTRTSIVAWPGPGHMAEWSMRFPRLARG